MNLKQSRFHGNLESKQIRFSGVKSQNCESDEIWGQKLISSPILQFWEFEDWIFDAIVRAANQPNRISTENLSAVKITRFCVCGGRGSVQMQANFGNLFLGWFSGLLKIFGCFFWVHIHICDILCDVKPFIQDAIITTRRLSFLVGDPNLNLLLATGILGGGIISRCSVIGSGRLPPLFSHLAPTKPSVVCCLKTLKLQQVVLNGQLQTIVDFDFLGFILYKQQ